MAYFMINDIDFSACVSGLKVGEINNYNAQTNAAGNTVADFINKKRTIEVNIIPLTDDKMLSLLAAIDAFNVSISFRNPKTNSIETANCIIPSNDIDYYTIQSNKVLYKAFSLKFSEL